VEIRFRSSVLDLWERHLMLFPIFKQAVYPLLWPSLTKDMQTHMHVFRQTGPPSVLEWYEDRAYNIWSKRRTMFRFS